MGRTHWGQKRNGEIVPRVPSHSLVDKSLDTLLEYLWCRWGGEIAVGDDTLLWILLFQVRINQSCFCRALKQWLYIYFNFFWTTSANSANMDYNLFATKPFVGRLENVWYVSRLQISENKPCGIRTQNLFSQIPDMKILPCCLKKFWFLLAYPSLNEVQQTKMLLQNHTHICIKWPPVGTGLSQNLFEEFNKNYFWGKSTPDKRNTDIFLPEKSFSWSQNI